MAYVCILPFARGRMWAANLRDELLLAAAGLSGGSLYFLTENMALEYAPASNVSLIVWHGARVDRRGDEPLLSRRADVAAADRRLGAGIRGDGARGAQRAFRAPPLAAGRHAGALGGDAMDGLFAGDQTPRRPLPRYLHHPESLFLRTRDDPPGLCVPAFRRGLGSAVAARRVGQPALSGRRGLDALLRALERCDAPSGSRQDNQLHLFQPAGDDRRSDALHRASGSPSPLWPERR